jgi:hypothetical protein
VSGRRPCTTLASVAVSAALLASAAGCGTPPSAARTPPAKAAPSASAAPGAPAGAAPAALTGGPVPHTPGKVILGSYIDLSGRTEAQSLALRRQELGRDPRILHRFYNWTDTLPHEPQNLPAGSIQLLSWAGTSYRSVLDGSQDALITHAAQSIAAYRQPLFIRWAWEMNGSWYAWGGAKNGDRPADFVAAWRHIHDIFVANHATNVAWVWGPNYESLPKESWNDAANYYPGDDYVDWVAVSGYFVKYQTCDSLFGALEKRFGARKPIMIAETGALDKDVVTKPERIRQLGAWIIDHPSVGALVWFDTDTDHGSGKNWRIDSSPAALEAYRGLATDPVFGG